MSEEYLVIKTERITEEMKDGRWIIGLGKTPYGDWEKPFGTPMRWDTEAGRWKGEKFTWITFTPTHCLPFGIPGPEKLITMYESRTKAIGNEDGGVSEVILLTNEMKSRIPCGSKILVMEKN